MGRMLCSMAEPCPLFRQRPIKQGKLILLGPILLKAISKLHCQKTSCSASLDSSEVQPSLRDSFRDGRSHADTKAQFLDGRQEWGPDTSVRVVYLSETWIFQDSSLNMAMARFETRTSQGKVLDTRRPLNYKAK